jgi:hypothetical protein
MSTKDLPLLYPEKKERHENCRPPKEAYFFIPSEEDKIKFEIQDQKQTRRKIFDIKEDYLEFEKYRLNLLKEEVQNLINKGEEELKEITEWKDGYLLRFLQSTSYDNSDTIKLFRDHLAWKKSSIFPLDLNENISNIINSGFTYVHGRDNHFRPIIIVRANTFLKIKDVYEFKDIVKAIIYFIEYIIMYMLIPGQVENWNIIIDLYDVSIFSMSNFLMKILKILQSNYRARLNSMFIVGMSPWLNAIWTIVNDEIDSNTQKKIKFIKENAKYELFEFINNEQLEKKYGGLSKNLEDSCDGYFPPYMPSDNYLKNNDVKEELLIDEDQYIDALSMGIISQVSPYMSEKIKKRESLKSVSRYDGKLKINP